MEVAGTANRAAAEVPVIYRYTRCRLLEHFHADWKSQSDVRPMKLLAEFELERFQSG